MISEDPTPEHVLWLLNQMVLEEWDYYDHQIEFTPKYVLHAQSLPLP
jgi:hypothetical protein